MTRSEVRLAEQDEDHGVGMLFADLGNLCRSVTIASSDFPQVFTGHAIETVNGLAMVASREQQFVEGSPIVAPVKIEADALTQFGLVNFAAPPFFENVLVAGKDGFDSEHHRAISGKGALLEQRCGIALGGGQGVVVTNQDNVGGMQSILNLLRVQQRSVAAEGLTVLAQILTPAVRILGADFALYSGQRMELSGAAPGSQIGRGCHKRQLLASGFWLLASRFSSTSLTPVRRLPMLQPAG